MPTENRSSNTEMVSVQATIESLEEAYAGDSALEFMNDAAQLLRQFKSLSTLEHQGEPVAYLITPPGCSPALVFARDIGQPSKYAEPLYTHADLGEVERLRVEIADLLEENRLMTNANAACGRELVELRAQLAERDALLADIKTKLNGQCWAWPGLIRRIDELSASAEPSAKHQKHCLLLDPEEPEAECNCAHRFMSLADHPRRCADCDAIEVIAPVERDERAEFEALHDKTWPRCEFLHLSHHEYGKKLRWEGWQARAALARKS